MAPNMWRRSRLSKRKMVETRSSHPRLRRPKFCVYSPLRDRERIGSRRGRNRRGRSSGVEHNLAKVGVEGSNPFARSSFLMYNQSFRVFFSDSHRLGFLTSEAILS